ncbi:Thiamine-monophosphate kinase [Metallosphaera sp. J1]|uniref:thiamine-phosphate kinase n=1 Tax=Metallosphaera javensis (ex Hofmann et al. 2022) TaxID=99938 RepID=UPI001EDE6A8A|nr:thiamine-phosphate kinase [Metallosphaera javensis (ex Hofmann et al. 2022)]MCG3107849.1 Thiamine-monophosphate kinase [Metallosphaera javensis (ex Hofmann et al. 2022)]
MKLRELGEHKFIETVISKYVDSDVNLDVYRQGNIVLKIDGFPIKYTMPFMDLYDLGWKAVVATMSDLISYGAIPSVVLSSFGLSPEIESGEAEKMIMGMSDASRYYGAIFGGGDTNSSQDSGWIDVAILGNPICGTRPKAEPGDLLYITGELGRTTGAFLWYISGGKSPLIQDSLIKLKHPVVDRAILRAHSELCNAIALGTDVSDGILVSLNKIARYIGYGINIDNIPLVEYIQELVDKNIVTMDEVLRSGGEEYETIFVVKKESLPIFLDVVDKYGISMKKIGSVIDSEPEIRLSSKRYDVHGWDNFKGWF